MKKKNLIFSAVGVGLLAAATVSGFVHFQKQHSDHFLKVGIAVYDLEDPYIQTLTDAIRSQLKDKTIDGREIIYDVFDASGSAVTQNTQLYDILQQEYDVILWNPVSPTNVVGILEDAQEQDVPVILFNREPAKADLEEQDNVWYVGTEAKEAGNMQGEMLIQAWNTCEMDKNRNGMLDYILVEGEQAHTDVINRTDAFLQTASAALPLNQLHVISADWARTSALREMQNLSAEETTEVEAVICSNDSMALGVADFYAKQKLPLPVIIGINGIQDMQDAIDAGVIYGTVDLNVPEQAKTIQGYFDAGAEMPKEKVCYLPQSPYTK
jgi:methyl-galactoside transport system substrate-binding protein